MRIPTKPAEPSFSSSNRGKCTLYSESSPVPYYGSSGAGGSSNWASKGKLWVATDHSCDGNHPACVAPPPGGPPPPPRPPPPPGPVQTCVVQLFASNNYRSSMLQSIEIELPQDGSGAPPAQIVPVHWSSVGDEVDSVKMNEHCLHYTLWDNDGNCGDAAHSDHRTFSASEPNLSYDLEKDICQVTVQAKAYSRARIPPPPPPPPPCNSGRVCTVTLWDGHGSGALRTISIPLGSCGSAQRAGQHFGLSSSHNDDISSISLSAECESVVAWDDDSYWCNCKSSCSDNQRLTSPGVNDLANDLDSDVSR